MSITLTQDTESRLREQAERIGEDVNALADVLLARALSERQSDDVDDLTEAQIVQIRTGISRGLAAASEGRERPVVEYAADVQRRRAGRNAGAVPHV